MAFCLDLSLADVLMLPVASLLHSTAGLPGTFLSARCSRMSSQFGTRHLIGSCCAERSPMACSSARSFPQAIGCDTACSLCLHPLEKFT